MSKISRAIAQFDYAVRLKKDPHYEGKVYVIGYHNKMEVLPNGKRRSRIEESFHIGPLQNNNQIKLGAAFLKRYPNFEGGEVYYLDNKLLTKSQYLKALKAKAQANVEQENTSALPNDEEGAAELEYSQSVVFDHYAKKNHYLQLFREIWKQDASKLYALLMFTCQRLGAFEHFDDFKQAYYLPCAQPLSSQRISEVCELVTSEKMEAFWQALIRTFVTGQESYVGCAIDSTSLSTYSELIEYAEWGYNKQGEALPQVNLTAITDVKTGRVFYAKEVPGSVPDVASFSEQYQGVLNKTLPKDRIYLIMDRGYESHANIMELLKNGTKFVMGAKVISNKLLRDQFLDLHEELSNPENFLSQGIKGLYGMKGKAVHFVEESAAGTLTYTLYPRLYVDPVRQSLMSTELDRSIQEALRLRQMGEEVPMNLWRTVRPYLVERDGVWKRNIQKVREDRRYFGTFALWTNLEEDSAEETLLKYSERNEIEEQFRWMKAEERGRRMYCSERSYRAVLLLNVLAASLRQQLSKDIKTSSYCQKEGVFTVPKYLAQLAGLRIKYQGHRWRVVQPTAKRRRLLESLSIKLD